MFPSRPAPALVTALALALPTLLAPAAAQALFDEATIDVILTGGAQTPVVVTDFFGECTGRLVPASGDLSLACTNNVPNAGNVLIKRDSPGAAGTVLATVGSGAAAGADLNLNPNQVALLLTGRLWVVVTSPSRPQGHVAARLLPRTPLGQQVMRFPLRNDSLVDNGSSATGHCMLRISADQSDVDVLCTHSVSNPQQLRLIIDGNTAGTANNVQSPFQANLPALAADYDRFLDGDFGLVLTSAAFPQGELGMVLDRCIEGPHTLCLNNDRFRVTVQFNDTGDPPAPGGTVPSRAADSGMFWFFGPENWELLIKVLTGCPVTQHFWVFLSANTDVRFTVTVYDTLTGRTKTYTNPQGQLADPVADTFAFPCS